MNEPVIECGNLSVELGGTRVIDGLTLTVYEQDFLGIVGPNGGGKTTLLRVFLGLEKSYGGTVHVFGSPPGSYPERMGYVPQRLFFDREFPVSVRELVLMGRLSHKKLFRNYDRADREKADEALRLTGLERLSSRRIGTLSGGELQRALIARALAGEPRLLLLDEPTANVDPGMKITIYDLLDYLRKSMTIVMVSHDTGMISRHVTRIACLNCTLDMHEPGSSLGREALDSLYRYPVDVIAHLGQSGSQPEKSPHDADGNA